MFRSLPAEALAASAGKLGDGSIFALPAFSLPKISWAAVAAIMPIAIATIPESTAHIYQLDIYVNDLAEKKGKKKYGLADMLHKNLIGDGISDMISGFVGGPAGTNYGENIGGLEIYLFGAIAAQGIAIMIDKKVNMFSAKNVAVIASVMIIGVGGEFIGGSIPFFGMNVPCIAGAAIFGIFLNLILSIGEKKAQ
jgi:uracil permease